MLIHEMRAWGNWLFRQRSYLPLSLFALALPALPDYRPLGDSPAFQSLWEFFSLGVAFLGLAVRIYTAGQVPAGTSGRNTLKQVARHLNVTGIYSIVRHPLYLGNFFMWLGLSLLPRCWWLTLLICLIFWLYYERIMVAEEAFLEEQFGEDFRQWAAQTPAFIPRFAAWRPPELPFSFKAALAREYGSFYALILGFSAFQALAWMMTWGRYSPGALTPILLVLGTGTYGIIRFLKKSRGVLRVEGR
uniref:DUF1295 domain-containing protein n=1 Tax=Desulfobacca acetoxidans TaxID=60893 RepID=A0A7C5ENE4_9BACT